MRKRGQAAGTAVLIAIIAALLIMFIIFIPPQDRADLLGEKLDSSANKDAGRNERTISEKLLLEVSPGRVDYLAQKEVEHTLPAVNIYTRTEAKILAENNVVYVKKGIFSEQVGSLQFTVNDLSNTKNFLLSLTSTESSGKLLIKLNGEEIFRKDLQQGSLPIPLPRNLLRENNLLEFSASSPGLAFWITNELILEKIKVVADVTSLAAQSSSNVFLVSETEKKNLERVWLKFQPSCKFDEIGKLLIIVNGKEIYSAVPDCNIQMVPLEFSPEHLNQGENEIVFHTEKGTYLLTHVVIESELKDLDFPIYYFDLSYEEFQAVKDDRRRVKVNLEFVDVVARKSGNLEFNGHINYFDTKEVSYSFDISRDVVQGANALKIKPRKTIDIRKLKVDLVK